MRFLAIVGLYLLAFPALAGGFGPWTFGMSASEIRAVESSGPYRAFSNGDLETYNADFGGAKHNAQFYLKDGRLWRIAISTYEGADLSQAAQAWINTYATLKETYGEIKTPNLSGDTPEALAAAAKAIVADGGKAQMAPVSQHEGEFVFSSFSSFAHDGVTYYTVTVNYDQPAP